MRSAMTLGWTRPSQAFVVGLVLLVPIGISPSAQATDPATIASLLNGMNGLVQQLETSSASLLEQGNIYLAQQQSLLAGTIEATIRQIEGAYGSSLQKTYDALSTVERNSFEELQGMLTEVRRTLDDVDESVETTIYTTQSGINQVLDRLPGIKRRPLIFGIKTKDLLLERENVEGDILILGHLLADPKLDLKKPDVTVAGEAIDPSLITATQNRITVLLPEDLKERLRLANTPCEPLKAFETQVRVYYDDGSWLNRWNPFFDGDEIDLAAASLPGNPFYEVSLRASGTATTVVAERKEHTVDSGRVRVGCEESRSTSVRWTAPEGARQVNATARWRSTRHLRSQSESASVSGRTATASGRIRGRDREFLNCPGGGRGVLRLTVTYVVDRVEESELVHEDSAASRDEQIRLVLPDVLPNGAFEQAELSLRRRGCDELIDEVAMPLPADRNARSEQSSNNGLFTVIHQQGQLTIKLPTG